jgi:hypothetical protein
MAKLLPELDPAKEEHAYLRRYKRDHFADNPSTVNLLYGVSALQVCLLSLGRLEEVVRLSQEIRISIGPEEARARELLQSKAAPEGTDTAALLTFEILREEIMPLGARAAHSMGLNETFAGLLTMWGPVPVGWRSRTKVTKLTGYYRVLGNPRKDVLLQGLTGLQGDKASERLFGLCRVLIMLFTDQLMFANRLPGVERLEEAAISKSMVSERIPVYQSAVEELLESKRRECSSQWF